MVLADLWCAVFCAQREKPHTLKEKYRSAKAKTRTV